MGARYVVSRLCQVAKKKHTLPVPLAMANPFPLSPWLSVPLPRGPHAWGVGGGGRRRSLGWVQHYLLSRLGWV